MHKTNSPESQGNITYAVLPDGSADVWIRKNEVSFRKKMKDHRVWKLMKSILKYLQVLFLRKR